MAGKILPAVLARNPVQLQRQWNLARDYPSIIHLDISDGTLVPGRTVSAKVLGRLDRKVPVEIHCMTNRPDRWLSPMMHLQTKRVILHVELGRQLQTYLAFVRSHNWQVTLAINPKTSLTTLWPWLKKVDRIQVMGINPGRQHAPWQKVTINRILTIHKRAPTMPISCDGGMTPETIPLVRQAGASSFIVGSYLQEHPDPDTAWKALQRAGRAK